MPKLTIISKNRTVDLRQGTELLTAYKQLRGDLPLKFGCCKGDCGVCKIKVLESAKSFSPTTAIEKATLARLQLPTPPYRLACQCAILDDAVIE